MGSWYCAQGGKQVGPYSTEQVQHFIAAGQLGRDDQVWKEGMPQWAPIRTLSELAAAPAPVAVPAQVTAPAAAPTPLNYAQPAASAGAGILATDTSLLMLRQTKPWVQFISVVMLVGAVLMFIMAVIAFFMGMGGNSSLGGAQGIVLIGVSLIYMVPAYFLSQYGTALGRLSKTRREDELETALRWQKSFWKFSGILTLLVILIYALVILVAVLGGSQFFR